MEQRSKLIHWNTFRKLLFTVLCVCLLGFVSCRDKDGSQAAYDPSKPVQLTSFYPDSGKYLEKVILTGENFGLDPDNIKVYFNSKRATVIGAIGNRMYTIAPRLPGDTCIISVVVGKDSVTYDKFFRYKAVVSVSTITGTGLSTEYQEGDVSEAILQPRYVCIDNEDNIFMTIWGHENSVYDGSKAYTCFSRLNEVEGMVSTVLGSTVCNIPCADPVTGVISVPTQTTVGSFITCDPKEHWAPRYREMKWSPLITDRPSQGWKHCMVVNPADGFLYTRYHFGHVVKINPQTLEVELVYKTTVGNGDTYGLTFRPGEPNILYMSFWSDSGLGFLKHSICSIDVTDPENTFKKLSGASSDGGHRDGPLEEALFRQPAQIYCDAEGNLYVADCGNHCIRRITPTNRVETVLGMPGTAGWKDGGKEVALFDHPMGIGISKDGSVYVGDWGNSRLRKLSIN